MLNLVALKNDKLNQAIKEFEALNGKIEEVCPEFVDSFVIWIKEALQNEDNFIETIVEDPDPSYWTVENKAGEIYNLFSESATPVNIDNLLDDLRARFHEIVIKDEIDNFIMALIEAIVQADADGIPI